MNKVRSYLSDWLEKLALKIAPDEEVFYAIPATRQHETPPLSAESNARTKKTKAKRKRQRARWRALEAAQRLGRFDQQ